MRRVNLMSRLGFIFVSAGCAIGLGNVWRFPYVVGQCGGGWFLLAYFFFLVALGVPLLTMEFATGRAARRSVIALHGVLAPGRRFWRFHGVLGFAANVLMMMFYTVVTGWMLVYAARFAFGGFSGLTPDVIGTAFDRLLGSPRVMTAATLAVTTVASLVVCSGVTGALERVSKWMMGVLLSLVLILAVNSVMQSGAARGVRFFLMPDTARLREVGVGNMLVSAMAQAFFTLSIGIGAMSVFGCYISRDRRLLGEAVRVVALDTVVAIAAAFVILPACFAYGIDPAEGPKLVFVTLLHVFVRMPLGRFWGAGFFLFMSFAALTTVFAVFENIRACLEDLTGWSRRRLAALLAVVMPLLALPCVLGFNRWSGFHPLGGGSTVLDLEDYVLSDFMLPLGAFAFAVFSVWRFGWGWEGFLAEANAGLGLRFPAWLRPYCAYVLPAVILTVLIAGLM